MRIICLLLLSYSCTTLSFIGMNAHADIYRYVDNEGMVHFTDAPAKGDTRFKSFMKEPTAKEKAEAAKNKFKGEKTYPKDIELDATAGINYIGEPQQWNPIGSSPMFSQKATIGGNNISFTLNCASEKIGISPSYLTQVYRVSYGPEVFTKVCKREPSPKPEIADLPVIPEKTYVAIKNRVLKENKALTKKISKGYVPDLPMPLKEDAAYKQLALNTKSIMQEEGLVSECAVKNDAPDKVSCNIYHGGKYLTWEASTEMGRIGEFLKNLAISNSQSRFSSSFEITSYLNIEGEYEAVYKVYYNSERGSYSYTKK